MWPELKMFAPSLGAILQLSGGKSHRASWPSSPPLSQQIPQGSDPVCRSLGCSGSSRVYLLAHLVLSLSLLASSAGLFINHPCIVLVAATYQPLQGQ